MVGQPGEGAGSEVVPSDRDRLRVSDDDRHRVAEVLRTSAGEGRIDLEELEERLESTYAAKTYGELATLTADLPASGLPTRLPPPVTALPVGTAAASHAGSFSVMGDCTRRGVWQVPERHTAFSVMGSITIDLREAAFTASEIVIDAYAIMASIDIIVNPSTRVVVDGVGIMGEMREARARVPAELTTGSPTVRVRGMALMASIIVKRRELPGPSRTGWLHRR